MVVYHEKEEKKALNVADLKIMSCRDQLDDQLKALRSEMQDDIEIREEVLESAIDEARERHDGRVARVRSEFNNWQDSQFSGFKR